MRHPKKKKATFFCKKSKVLNASILHQLRAFCEDRIQRLTGASYEARFNSPEDRFLAPQSVIFLDIISTEIATGVPRINVSDYIEAYAWARRYDGLHEKNLSLDSEMDPETVALETFRAAELHCRSINDRADGIYSCDPINGVTARNVISMLQRKIKNYLKDVPSLGDLHCKFGPGSSTTCKERTTPKWKLSSQLACARDSRSSLCELMALYPNLNWSNVICDPGYLFFVPKKLKSARSCMAEPILNSFVQLGIGSYMKRLLVAVGCNLYDQTTNRELARLASVSNEDATVDMTSASDNIACYVPKLLLPWEWYELLATWRTDIAALDLPDKPRELMLLHKFSSMGNGYTFELESCIFYACGQVACEIAGLPSNTVSCYGDDLIVPTKAIDCLYRILDMLGFKVNVEKSFTDGPFRESCGGDYLLGTDVRPFYVKDRFTDARLISMSNHVARSGYPDQEYRDLIERFVPKSNKLYGPDGYGDGHLIGYEFETTRQRPMDGWERSLFRTFTKVPARDEEWPVDTDRAKLQLGAYLAYERESVTAVWKIERLPSSLCVGPRGPIQNPGRLLVFDTPHAIGRFINYTKTKTYARESDVHVLRGGEETRLIRVSMPPGAT